jgi:hypothetical protein
VETFRRLASEAGWTLVRCWLDDAGLLSLATERLRSSGSGGFDEATFPPK